MLLNLDLHSSKLDTKDGSSTLFCRLEVFKAIEATVLGIIKRVLIAVVAPLKESIDSLPEKI